MSRIVLVCLRSPCNGDLARTRLRMDAFLATLRPDHLPDAPATVSDDGLGLVLGVFNPSNPAATSGTSAYVGWLLDGRERWWQPGAPVPDGTFGLIRADAEAIEVVADATASRPLYTAATDTLFVASTSQRAIPWFLGGFEPSSAARGWMLGHGAIGPRGAWDRRAEPVPPRGCVRLDRRTWRLTRATPTPLPEVDPAPDAVHAERLRAALESTFAAAEFDWSRWVLPLSGGVDSRAILLGLADRTGVRCITWGRRGATEEPGNDAYVARQVATRLGVDQRYFEIDGARADPERVLGRFLQAGEGRLDQLAGYVDGFELWRSLAAMGVGGIVRGDEGFGNPPVADMTEVRHMMELTPWNVIPGVPSFAVLGLEHLGEPLIPPDLEPRPGETAAAWGHRAVLEYRARDIWSHLNELKSPYVEIASPLLVRRILDVAAAQPAHLRDGKRLFATVVAPRNLPIPYATERAVAYAQDAAGDAAMAELLRDEMASRAVREILSPAFADFIVNALARGPRQVGPGSPWSRLRRAVGARLPGPIRAALRRRIGRAVPSAQQLALRAYLITQMAARLTADGTTDVRRPHPT